MATIEEIRKEFIEMFDEEYKQGVSMPDAYDKAEKRFSEKYNHRAYSNFSSFNVAKFNRAKREMGK